MTCCWLGTCWTQAQVRGPQMPGLLVPTSWWTETRSLIKQMSNWCSQTSWLTCVISALGKLRQEDCLACTVKWDNRVNGPQSSPDPNTWKRKKRRKYLCYILVLIMCMCVPVCECVSADACGGQKRAWDTFELELQALSPECWEQNSGPLQE